MPGKREDVISWDEFFMRAAVAASLRSKDPNTQVGACIADTNNRILSVGYNGTPSALNDDDFPWGTADDPLQRPTRSSTTVVLSRTWRARLFTSPCSRATSAPRLSCRRVSARSCTWTTSTAAPRTTLSPRTSSIAVASRIARSSSRTNISIGVRYKLIRRVLAGVKGDGCKLRIVRFAPVLICTLGAFGARWCSVGVPGVHRDIMSPTEYSRSREFFAIWQE